jgi:hypothetical protein
MPLIIYIPYLLDLINELCGCDLQNAAASLFRVPELTLATALNTEFSVLKKIANSISSDLTALEKSSKANCVPGKMGFIDMM